MANIKSAVKRARQSEKHRQHNASLRSRMRTYIKRVLNTVAEGNLESAQTAYREAVSAIDTGVDKRLIHKNKANRHKRRLNARLRSMS